MDRRAQQTLVTAMFVALAFGVGTAFVIVRLLLAMWETCEIGINSGANLFGVLLYAPLFTVIAGLACGLAFGFVDLSAPTAAAYAATAATALLVVWAVLAWRHNPGGDYPEIVCEDNVPP